MATHDATAAALCSAGSPHPNGLNVADVTIATISADDCFGLLAQKTGQGTVGPLQFSGSPSDTNVNNAFTSLHGDGNFTLLFKAEEVSSQAGSPLDGITFSITGINFATTGTCDLNWTGGTIAPPKAFDLVIGLKGAKTAALYLFDDFLLTSTPGGADGTYTVALANPGGQTPDLSNITLFGRVGAPPPPTDVPEPMSLAIFGIGLLGLGYVARRRKHAA